MKREREQRQSFASRLKQAEAAREDKYIVERQGATNLSHVEIEMSIKVQPRLFMLAPHGQFMRIIKLSVSILEQGRKG
jgi:hypothetical protein